MHVIIAGGGFVRQGGVVLGWKERGLVFKAHRLLYHSTLCSRVIKKKKTDGERGVGLGHVADTAVLHQGYGTTMEP